MTKAESSGAHRLRALALFLFLAAILVTGARGREPQDRNRAEAERLTNEATLLRAAPDGESQRKAIEKFEESIPRWQAAGDRAQEAATLFKISAILRALGDNYQAIEHLEKALLLQRALSDNQAVVDTLGIIGDIDQTFGDVQKAIKAYEEALALAQRAVYRQGEGRTLSRIGLLLTSMGEYQKAIDAHSQALSIARTANDPIGEAGVLINAGQAQQLSGDNQRALESFRQSLTLFRNLENRSTEPAALNRVRAGEATALQNIAVVYGSLGDLQTALQWYGQSLSISRAGGNRQREAFTLNNMGSAYLGLGEYPKASEFYDRALELARTAGDRAMEGRTLHNLADLSLRIGDKRHALDSATQSLSILGAARDRRGEATVSVQIGSIYYLLGEPAKASEAYNQALPLTRTLKDAGGEARALAGLARIDRDRGNLDMARERQEAALSLIESIRGGVAIHELRASYFASTQGEYEFYIDLLMQLHKLRPSEGFTALAFHANERARARSLLELLAEGHADIRRGVDPTLLERERLQQQRLDATAERYIRMLGNATTKDQAASALQEIEAQAAELDQIEGEIRSTSPRYAALTQPAPLSLQEVQKQVLDPNTLLLEYVLGPEHSYLWAVTKTSFAAHELPPRAVIEAAAHRVYDLLTSRQLQSGRTPPNRLRLAEADAQYGSEAATLSQMLLGPVAQDLGTQRLLIVSDGALQYLPFAALPVPRSDENDRPGAPLVAPLAVPLVQEHEVVSMPSASTIGVLRRELAGRVPAAKGVAVFADPVFDKEDARVRRSRKEIVPAAEDSIIFSDPTRAVRGAGLPRLVFSRREAAGILSAVRAGEAIQALDFEANRGKAIDSTLSQFRIIHFATHGILDSEHPELSGIVLSLVDQQGETQDGLLRLHDLYNLNLPAELVVLSACQTGLGKDIKGEGLVGLTRGFMYAGAARVVASLWKVDDAATAELMKRFYQGMLGSRHLSPAAALRAAQSAMSRQKQWAAPYYWAAFVLQGEWNGWERGDNLGLRN